MKSIFNLHAKPMLQTMQKMATPSLMLGLAAAALANYGGRPWLAGVMALTQVSLAYLNTRNSVSIGKKNYAVRAFTQPLSFGINTLYYGVLFGGAVSNFQAFASSARKAGAYAVTCLCMMGFYGLNAVRNLPARSGSWLDKLKSKDWVQTADTALHAIANIAFADMNAAKPGASLMPMYVAVTLPVQRMGVLSRIALYFDPNPLAGKLQLEKEMSWHKLREGSTYAALAAVAYLAYSTGLDVSFASVNQTLDTLGNLITPGSQGNLLLGNILASSAFGTMALKARKQLMDLSILES